MSPKIGAPSPAEAIDSRDVFRARALHELAVATLGPLSVGELTDLLADQTPWTVTYCHAIAHKLVPAENCRRQACSAVRILCVPGGRIISADQV